METEDWADPFEMRKSCGPDRSNRKHRIKKWHIKGGQGFSRGSVLWIRAMGKIGNHSMRQQRKRDAGNLLRGKEADGKKETRSSLKFRHWRNYY